MRSQWVLMQRYLLASAMMPAWLAVATTDLRADSWEIQSNPIVNGAIQIDDDRTDWQGIPAYEVDDDEIEFFPIDLDEVFVAHDAANVYFRVKSLAWETEETWRVGLYLDTDLDTTTGYNGNFLAIGSDHFVEGDALFRFTGAGQADWGWEQQEEVVRDQSQLTDFELAIPRTAMGNPEEIDFLLFANNFCCDFGEPDDIYPNVANALGGDFLTYELTEVEAPAGDFNGDGTLATGDVNLLIDAIATSSDDTRFDVSGDGLIDPVDLTTWVKTLKNTWFGDANLDGEFSSSDLVSVFAAGKFEQDEEAGWDEGDWDADKRFTTGDLVAAFSDGGFENGPRAAVAAVPEPSSVWLLAGILLWRVKRR